MSLTFYYHPISQPSRSVLSLLELGGIKYEGKILNTFKRQARTPEYLELNPFGGVPFIIHGKLHLSESSAILVHLVQAFPQQLKGYYGQSSDERDQINQYLSWFQGTYRPKLVKPFHILIEGWRKNKPVSKSAIAAAEAQIKEVFKTLESLLSKSSSGYLVGNRLTIADLLLVHQTTDVQIKKLAQFPSVNAWFLKVSSNPVIAKIIANYYELFPAVFALADNLTYIE